MRRRLANRNKNKGSFARSDGLLCVESSEVAAHVSQNCHESVTYAALLPAAHVRDGGAAGPIFIVL